MYKFVRFVKPNVGLYIDGVRVRVRHYDKYSESGFEKNEFNGIRSDFAQLINSQSILVMNQAAQRLQELRSVEPDNSNKSFDEIVASVRPRWVDSPKRMIEFEKYLIDNQIAVCERISAQIEAQKKAELAASVPANE